jgi:hypothetical protein
MGILADWSQRMRNGWRGHAAGDGAGPPAALGPGAALQQIDDRVDAFCGKYSPAIAAELREVRHRLHAVFPRGYELVYDNHNALVLGIGPTPRSADAVLKVVGYPRWVTLFFLRGTGLDAPAGLLEPGPDGVPGLRLRSAVDLARSDVQTLLLQLSATHAEAFRGAPPLTTLIKAQAPEQRSRRPQSPRRVRAVEADAAVAELPPSAHAPLEELPGPRAA